MGILGLFQSESDKRASEIRAGAVVPTRAERKRCWEARDDYFACLDASGIVDPLKDEKKAAKACAHESTQFERDCATQWVGSALSSFLSRLASPPVSKPFFLVTYFKKWRVQDIQKKARLKELEAQGANKLDVATDFTARK